MEFHWKVTTLREITETIRRKEKTVYIRSNVLKTDAGRRSQLFPNVLHLARLLLKLMNSKRLLSELLSNVSKVCSGCLLSLKAFVWFVVTLISLQPQNNLD